MEKWMEWIESRDYSATSPVVPPIFYWPPPAIIYESDGLKSYPVPFPVPVSFPNSRPHPYARAQPVLPPSVPIFGYQPFHFPFVPGFPEFPSIAYRQMPFMGVAKPEQHLPDDILEIILDLESVTNAETRPETETCTGNDSTQPDAKLYKPSSQNEFLDERSELELLEHDLDSEPTDTSDLRGTDDSGFIDSANFEPETDESPEFPEGPRDEQDKAILLFKTKLELQEPKRLKTKLITKPFLPTAHKRHLACEFCGKSYQSLSGLKYHREKARTKCTLGSIT